MTTPIKRLKVGLQKFLEETSDPAAQRTTQRLLNAVEKPADRAKGRPKNYNRLSPQAQWAVDKELGILDWDGK